jgi:predicted protein tyrosine phosphatase
VVNKVFVYSRQVIKDWICLNPVIHPPKDQWALISIYDKEDGPLINKHAETILSSLNCKAYLSIKFFDVAPSEFNIFAKQIKGISLQDDFFNKKHAKTILLFLNTLKEQDTLIVHCAAGISRSGAVGLFSNRYFNLKDSIFRLKNPHIAPNPHILETLNKVSGINDSYLKFWKESFNKNNRLQNIRRLKLF